MTVRSPAVAARFTPVIEPGFRRDTVDFRGRVVGTWMSTAPFAIICVRRIEAAGGS
jgi:hypothetical protein